MLHKHLATALLGLGAISPLMVHSDQPTLALRADQPQTKSYHQKSNKKMQPQFEMGDPIETGSPGQAGYVPAAYNYPAGIRAPNQDWDVYVTGSFIYWKPHQDNMFMGVGTDAANPIAAGTGFDTTGGLENQVFFNRKPGYQPGFKVGLGWNTGGWDNWTLYGEYTWYHTGSGKDKGEDDCDDCGCAPQLVLVPACPCAPSIFASNLEAEWKLRLDIGDLVVGRPAYQGKRLILNPFFGLRAMWLKQKSETEFDGVSATLTPTPVGEYEVEAHSKCWALGPRIGVDGSWLLGAGFRIVGNASASLLYTRYTHVNYSSNIPNSTALGTPLPDENTWKFHKNFNTVRPNCEIDAGVAWGIYCGDEYHIDFAATYDFHAFWGQNMMADIANWAVHSVDAAPGNLFLHGLTFKARFDF